ncbi:MAG: hypothetical protein R3F49_13000 [Planctomycetota bacterium]
MDSQIRNIGEWNQIPPPRRDRKPRQDGSDAFHRELDEATDDEQHGLRDAIVHPKPRVMGQPVAPPTPDEVGMRVDVEA